MSLSPEIPGRSPWAEQVRLRLAAGLARDPSLDLTACQWLAWAALTADLIALGLFLAGGYHAGFVWLNGVAAALPDRFWEWMTVLGDARLAMALALFFSLRHPRLFWALILAALIATALTHGLKPWVAAWRPAGVLPADSFHLIGPALRKGSFPSGHSVTVAVLTGVWVCQVKGSAARLPLLMLAMLVGMSRVAVGAHWPLDVVAGLGAGWLAAWIGLAWSRRWAWLAAQLPLHLAGVALTAGAALLLLGSDGGYRGARELQICLGLAALTWGLGQYLFLPLIRRGRGGQAARDQGRGG